MTFHGRASQFPLCFPEINKFEICIKKTFVMQYCFNQKMETSCFFLFYFMFFLHYLSQCVDSQSAERIFNLMQNHAHHKTTPNTVSERPSKLTVSVTFDDFYRFSQTFWCSIVGVFLIETYTNKKNPELFSKRFCIERLFYFITIYVFHETLYLWF